MHNRSFRCALHAQLSAHACGATLHLIPENLFLFPVKLVEYLIQYSITFIFWVPSAMVSVVPIMVASVEPFGKWGEGGGVTR